MLLWKTGRALVLLTCCFVLSGEAQETGWRFAVSGDSRNCGDVVMPAIAKGAIANKAEFYWHLGDFRAIYRFDQDYAQEQNATDIDALNISKYLHGAWQDFIDNQLKPFGRLPVYLAFGNHELIYPMTREQLLADFSFWLNDPAIREQRLADGDEAVEGYYHWMKNGIDFITLDNSASDFDPAQMKWIRRALDRDAADDRVRALVVGMHEALPESISRDHSMNQTPEGTEHGLAVYQWLLDVEGEDAKAGLCVGQPFALLHGGYLQHGVLAHPWRSPTRMDHRDSRGGALQVTGRRSRCLRRQGARLRVFTGTGQRFENRSDPFPIQRIEDVRRAAGRDEPLHATVCGGVLGW